MPKIKLEIPHTLSAEDARAKLEHFSEKIPQDQVTDLKQTWNGNTLTFSFKTMGIKLGGDLTAADQKLLVALDLPFAAMMFKGKIETEMKQQLERLME